MILEVFRRELHYGSKFEIIEYFLFFCFGKKSLVCTKAALTWSKKLKQYIVKCDYNLKELLFV